MDKEVDAQLGLSEWLRGAWEEGMNDVMIYCTLPPLESFITFIRRFTEEEVKNSPNQNGNSTYSDQDWRYWVEFTVKSGQWEPGISEEVKFKETWKLPGAYTALVMIFEGFYFIFQMQTLCCTAILSLKYQPVGVKRNGKLISLAGFSYNPDINIRK